MPDGEGGGSGTEFGDCGGEGTFCVGGVGVVLGALLRVVGVGVVLGVLILVGGGDGDCVGGKKLITKKAKVVALEAMGGVGERLGDVGGCDMVVEIALASITNTRAKGNLVWYLPISIVKHYLAFAFR